MSKRKGDEDILQLEVEEFLSAKEIEFNDPDRPMHEGEPTFAEMERYVRERTMGLKGWFHRLLLCDLEDRATLREWQFRDLLIRQQYLQLQSPWPYMAHPFSRIVIFSEIIYVFYFPIFFVHVLSSASYKSFVESSKLMQQILDVLNFLLVFLNFLTGIYESESGNVILNPKKVATQYVTSYPFWVDIISSPPTGFMPRNRFVYSLAILFVVKACRIQYYMIFLRKGLVRIGFSVNPLELYGFFFLLSLLYMYIPYITDIVTVKWNYDESDFVRWFTTIRYTIEVLFNLTYVDAQILKGEWAWYTVATKWYVFLITPLVSGAFMLSYSYKSLAEISYVAIIADVKAFACRMALPKGTRKKLCHYYWLRYRGSLTDGRRFLELIPEYKQAAFFKSTYRIMMRVPLFNEIPHDCYIDIRKKSRKDFVFPGYEITIAGLYGRRMFVIMSGSFTLYAANGTKLVEIQDGGHIGELQLIQDSPYLVTARCNELSLVLVIERLVFYELLASDTALSETISENVLRRHQRMVDLLAAILEDEEETREEAEEH